MTRKSLVLPYLILLTQVSVAQTKYYVSNTGAVYDSLSYASAKAEKAKKVASFLPGKDVPVKIRETFTEVRRTKDSLLYAYKWDVAIGMQKQEGGFSADAYLNKPFPLTALRTLTGQRIDLASLKGKPTLINFWFTTCKPCIEEMPVLSGIKDRLNGQANFVAITFDPTVNVEQFLKKNPFNFTQVANAQTFIDTLKMNTFPVNVFLDKAGNVVRVASGIPYVMGANKELMMGDGKDFEETLRKLL